MSVLLRAEDQAHFRDAIADTIVPFGLTVAADADPRARILTGHVGTVHVTKVSGPPHAATRTARLIPASDPELERCRRDLADPAMAHWSVSAIGTRWALSNPAHFSRVFHAAYGLAPSEYRRVHARSSVVQP